MTYDKNAPDWMPASSAWNLPEGTQRHGSTGQLFEVRNQRWVRVEKDRIKLVEPPADGELKL